jgi:L-iditol 2-dehydrogenase
MTRKSDMRAVVLEAEGRLVLTRMGVPAIAAPDQVLVQVKTVGICGSEVHAYRGTHPTRKAPTILGHEAAGVVAAVGPEAEACQPGDRVLIDPQWTCGECVYCRAGDINLCPSKRVLGTPAWPGAFAEYVVVPQEAVFALPSHLSYVQGSLVEPLTVAVHVARRAGVRAGEAVAILGSGSIGGMLSGVCHVLGADPIIAADIRQHCLDAARERLGATHDFLLPDGEVVDKVRAASGGEGVDVAFCTADDASLVNLAVEMVKRRGRILFVALMTASPVRLEAYRILSKELQIIGSSMSSHADVARAIDLAASGEVDVEGILTHVLPIEEAERGIELARTKAEDAIKVILSFER